MTFGLQDSVLSYQELLFHQVRCCPPSLAPTFQDLVVGLKELVIYPGEMLADLRIMVPALDEHYPSGLFLVEHPYSYEFQAEDLDFPCYH